MAKAAEPKPPESTDDVPAKRCFVITPIGDDGSPERRHADWTFHIAIEPVFAQRGYEVGRADLIPHAGLISDKMFDNILNADVCVADLSHLNANVFYELGVRHMAEKPVIHIIEAAFKVPFDNKDHNTIPFQKEDYHSMIRLKSEIDRQLTAIEAPDFKLTNPVSIFRELQALRNSSDPKDQKIAELERRLSEMEQARVVPTAQTVLPTRPRTKESSRAYETVRDYLVEVSKAKDALEITINELAFGVMLHGAIFTAAEQAQLSMLVQSCSNLVNREKILSMLWSVPIRSL